MRTAPDTGAGLVLPHRMRLRRKKTEAAPPASSSAGTRLSADEIYENVSAAAEEELDRSFSSLAWSALAAGLIIGFSFFAAAYLGTLASDPWKHAAQSAGYPLGFIFVVLARNQLFTENTLEPIIPLLRKPTWPVFRKVLGLWGAVFAGNIAGALLVAWVAARTPMLDGALSPALRDLSRGATEGGFLIVAYRAVFAGWLIALMAWLVASTHETLAQVTLIWLTTAPIAMFGFRHSIAGAVEAFYRAFSGDASWSTMLGSFLVPAVIGNIVGGVFLVALLNHGQVSAAKRNAG